MMIPLLLRLKIDTGDFARKSAFLMKETMKGVFMENKFDIKKLTVVVIVIGAIVGIVTIVKKAISNNN